ncbi:MAG: threonylcarbamoyl-AMP synthase [Rhodospirillaceae bacterium]|nr:threonylcarbamoyl-AMP synthase [Rhodospirillaceae bacterium]
MAGPTVLPASAEAIAAAAAALCEGRLVAFPTETVYGLGGDATNERAVAAIFAAKGRPRFNPLIVHFADAAAARRAVAFDDRAERLAAAFWPGPLTLVLPRRPDCAVALLASAGLDTLAVRVPAHPVAHALIAACGRPVAAPSANASGRLSPTAAEDVVASLGARVDIVLDGGRCPVGVESTVVDLTTAAPTLLRPGGVTEEALEPIIGPLARPGRSGAPRSPGMLASHYAPERPLRLEARAVGPDEALLAFGRQVPQGATETLNLSPSGDLAEAAANLFAMLRRLDRPRFARIAVMPIPEVGLGRAINDRLRRAAQR